MYLYRQKPLTTFEPSVLEHKDEKWSKAVIRGNTKELPYIVDHWQNNWQADVPIVLIMDALTMKPQ